MSAERHVALVTGCGPGGIGAAICRALLSHGCTVYATDVSMLRLDDLKRLGCRCLEMNVSDPTQIKAAVSSIIADAGRIDLLINNAGIMSQGSVLDTPVEATQQCLDVNVLGALRMLQAVTPYMMQASSGTIVNIGSVLGYTGMPFLGSYSASKAALQAATDAARVELRPFNIRVVYVAPGWVSTRLSKHALSAARTFLPPNSPYRSLPWAAKAAAQDLYDDPGSASAGATPVGAFAAQLVPLLLQEPSWFSWQGWCKHIVCGHMGRVYWAITCYLPSWLLDLVYGWHFGLLLVPRQGRGRPEQAVQQQGPASCNGSHSSSDGGAGGRQQPSAAVPMQRVGARAMMNNMAAG